jgi:hypothetical protein
VRQFRQQRVFDGTGANVGVVYLTATSSEDWGLTLEVCQLASATGANAKEAVKALRRELMCVS